MHLCFIRPLGVHPMPSKLPSNGLVQGHLIDIGHGLSRCAHAVVAQARHPSAQGWRPYSCPNWSLHAWSLHAWPLLCLQKITGITFDPTSQQVSQQCHNLLSSAAALMDNLRGIHCRSNTDWQQACNACSK